MRAVGITKTYGATRAVDDLSFDALAGVIRGNDHSLTRPYRGTAKAVDFVQLAREEGESLVQAFHPSINQRGGHLDAILRENHVHAAQRPRLVERARAQPRDEFVQLRIAARRRQR